MTELQHLIGAAENLVREHGAVAVMVIILLEAIGAPAPGESLLVFASALAARGELSWHALFFGAWTGAVVGDNLGFAVGRYGGRALALRYGARLGLNAERLGRVEAFYARYGPIAVMLARFVAFARQLNGFVSGALAMDWRRFALLDAVGAALWVAVWMLVGGFVGEHAATLLSFGRRFWPLLISLALGAIVLAAFIRRRRAGR